MSKILTVFGANGQQGGSLIAYLLKHPTLILIYKLRGVTRDPSKPAAAALKEKGVEVVQVSQAKRRGSPLRRNADGTKADIDDNDSLKDAVAGSYAVFAVTNCTQASSHCTLCIRI